MTAPASGKVDSFAARGHARWMVIAAPNRRERGIFDAAFGEDGAMVATVSFEDTYSHMPEYGATMAADYAERLVACVDAMKGIADPRAFVAAVAALIAAAEEYKAAHDASGSSVALLKRRAVASDRLHAALAACGGAK